MQECDDAAAAYYDACYKAHRKPKRKQYPRPSWTPTPGAGIAPHYQIPPDVGCGRPVNACANYMSWAWDNLARSQLNEPGVLPWNPNPNLSGLGPNTPPANVFKEYCWDCCSKCYSDVDAERQCEHACDAAAAEPQHGVAPYDPDPVPPFLWGLGDDHVDPNVEVY
jgi:hypothetical protein